MGVDLRRNFGQDNAILTGLRFARGRADRRSWTTTSSTTRPTCRPCWPKLDDGADVVYADFRVKHQAAWKNLGSWFNGKVAEWVLDKPQGIYLSPYKVIRREVAELICRYDGPEPYVDGLLFQVTSRFAQVPVEHHPRYAGRSNYNLRAVDRRLGAAGDRVLGPAAPAGDLVRPGSGALGGLLAVVVVAYRLLYPERFAAAVAGWASLMVTAC